MSVERCPECGAFTRVYADAGNRTHNAGCSRSSVTDLDVTLTPAQWEHLDRHDWTLVAAPTIPSPVTMRAKPNDIPVPATVQCPECHGTGRADVRGAPPCVPCKASGAVPRTVGIVRPGRECPECFVHDVMCGEWPCPHGPCRHCGGKCYLPAERVGTATVTAVPVVEWPGHSVPTPRCTWDPIARIDFTDGWHTGDVTALFATPPAPGTTVWRLGKENNHE